MNQTQFDGLTIEEREAILEKRDRLQRERAISHPPALALALQSEDSKTLWLLSARELVKERPELALSLKGLTEEVMRWCASRELTKDNGKPYAERTIYNFLKRNRVGLVRDLASLGQSAQRPDSTLAQC